MHCTNIHCHSNVDDSKITNTFFTFFFNLTERADRYVLSPHLTHFDTFLLKHVPSHLNNFSNKLEELQVIY